MGSAQVTTNRGVSGKIHPPRRRRGQVSRRVRIDHVLEQEPDLLIVTAAAGYGKSTFLAELASTDPRPHAWLTLDSTHDEPAALLADVAFALDRIETVDASLLDDLHVHAFSIEGPLMSRFGHMLQHRERPFLLVLDDVHVLRSGEALHALAELIDRVPPGSLLALGSRTQPDLPLGRLRACRTVVEVHERDLALDTDDAAAMLAAFGIEADPADVTRLVEHSEGWPMAVYLAGLAHRRDRRSPHVPDLAGDSRVMVDYFSEVFLSDLEPEVASFLLRLAPLERFCGPLCDEVLGSEGSSVLLEDLYRRNLLVVALDDRRQWYRLHHLFAEFLAAELDRREPTAAAVLLARASRWHEAHGDDEESVSYAVRSGDAERTARLVIELFDAYAARGRHATIERWMHQLGDTHLATYPRLLPSMSLAAFMSGDAAAAQRWLDRSVAVIGLDRPQANRGPDEHVTLAILLAGMRWMPATESRRTARYSHERLTPDDNWHAVSCLVLGSAEAMVGDTEHAEARFREVLSGSEHRLVGYADTAGLLAVLLAARGEWDEAIELSMRGRALLGDRSMLPVTAPLLAASAMAYAKKGDFEAAQDDHRLARSHLARYSRISPFLNYFTRIGLARASALAGRSGEAITLLDEADQLVGSTPDAVGVRTLIEQVRGELRPSRSNSAGFGPASLTTAELRVLQYLPTHLSVGEIAERLYLSRNTIKTHTITIYRKLGVSGRSAAVVVARSAGLID